LATLLGGISDATEEISPECLTGTACIQNVADHLRDEVQVAYRRKELGQLAEFLVDACLFQVSLRQPERGFTVLAIGPLQEFLSFLSNPLLLDGRQSDPVLSKAQLVFPASRLLIIADPDLKGDVRVLTGRQRLQLTYPSSPGFTHRCLKTPTN